ncbi:unnamed protein product, partial [Ectocarpus sp. 12 AP-2014]
SGYETGQRRVVCGTVGLWNRSTGSAFTRRFAVVLRAGIAEPGDWRFGVPSDLCHKPSLTCATACQRFEECFEICQATSRGCWTGAFKREPQHEPHGREESRP